MAAIKAFGKAFGIIYVVGVICALLIWGRTGHGDETLSVPVKPAALAPAVSSPSESDNSGQVEDSRNPTSSADSNSKTVNQDFSKDYLDKVNGAQQAADEQKAQDRKRHDKLIEFYMKH